MPPGLRFAILERAFKKRLGQWAGEKGLTTVQLWAICELCRLEKSGVEEVNQRDLERAERVSHPTMTEIIKRLEQKGFVHCAISETDRRYKKITATVKADAIHEELAAQDAAIFQELCRGLTQEQIDTLLQLTDLMLHNAAQEDHK